MLLQHRILTSLTPSFLTRNEHRNKISHILRNIFSCIIVFFTGSVEPTEGLWWRHDQDATKISPFCPETFKTLRLFHLKYQTVFLLLSVIRKPKRRETKEEFKTFDIKIFGMLNSNKGYGVGVVFNPISWTILGIFGIIAKRRKL